MKNYFVHDTAICESNSVGKDSKIWAFSHVMSNVKIGTDCNIGEHCFIESGVKIGNRVTVKNGIAIWDGVEIEDEVFLGPYCVLTNDMFPRSKVYKLSNIRTKIKNGASIGANATIICGVELGSYCMVGAGSVVNKNVPDFALVVGVPAKVIGYVSLEGEKLVFSNGKAMDSKGNKYVIENGIVSII